jgi:hypothetical protein
MEVKMEEGMIYVSMTGIPEVACYAVVMASIIGDDEGGVGGFDMHPRWIDKLQAMAEQSNAVDMGWVRHDRISYPCTVRLILPPTWDAQAVYQGFDYASKLVLESEGH